MAGFKRSKLVNEYVIKLADGDFEGLEIRCKEVDIGRVLDVVASVGTLEKLGDFDPANLSNSDIVAEADTVADTINSVYTTLLEGINSWNMEEDDGSATPVDEEMLRSIGFQNCFQILMAWSQGAVSVPDPLGPESPSGKPPPELSLATDG